MTIEEMKARKTELGLTNEMLAEQTGIPVSTLQKIFGGVTKAPRKTTIEAIAKVLRKKTDYADVYKRISLNQCYEGVKETAYAYAVGKDNRHTLDDYYALPEERRVELIDGVFYDMGAPSLLHQFIIGELYIGFRECMEQHKDECVIYLSPCDVRLDKNDYTVVQPDLFVSCEDQDIRAMRVEGAPDLALEVLSPSSRSRDMILKLFKYQQAGVREYWTVDPRYREVTVHYFEDEEYHPVTYTFESIIPIGISGGECSIDFSRINKRISKYYE